MWFFRRIKRNRFQIIIGSLVAFVAVILYKLGRISLVGEGGSLVPLKQLILQIFLVLSFWLAFYTVLTSNRRLLVKIYLAVGSLACSLFILELYIRIFHGRVYKNEDSRLYEYDSQLGWKLIAGKTATVVSSGEFSISSTISKQGLRDKEYSLEKKSPTKRVAILGDSFVSGLQVEAQQVFTEVLENQLQHTEVLNFGVTGYGPTQEYLQLKKDVLSFQPDVILLALFVGNDLDDLLGTYDWRYGYRRPQAVQSQGKLIIDNIPVPQADIGGEPQKVTFIPKSYLVQFLENILYDKMNLSNLQVGYETRFFNTQLTAEIENSYFLLSLLLREMQQQARGIHADFGILIFPTIVQVYDDVYWPKIKSEYGLNDSQYDVFLPNKKIAHIAEILSIPILDVTSDLKRARKNNPDLYFYKDRHLNEQGHQVVAEALQGFVQKHFRLE